MAGQYQLTGVVTPFEVKDMVLQPSVQTFPDLADKTLILNNVGRYIWKQLEAGVIRDDILAAIMTDFQIAQQEAETDLDFFLENLLYLGIVTEIPDNPQPSVPVPDPGPWRHPKIYVYDLQSGEEKQFGPHFCGKSWMHRTIAAIWHGGCC